MTENHFTQHKAQLCRKTLESPQKLRALLADWGHDLGRIGERAGKARGGAASAERIILENLRRQDDEIEDAALMLGLVVETLNSLAVRLEEIADSIKEHAAS